MQIAAPFVTSCWAKPTETRGKQLHTTPQNFCEFFEEGLAPTCRLGLNYPWIFLSDHACSSEENFQHSTYKIPFWCHPPSLSDSIFNPHYQSLIIFSQSRITIVPLSVSLPNYLVTYQCTISNHAEHWNAAGLEDSPFAKLQRQLIQIYGKFRTTFVIGYSRFPRFYFLEGRGITRVLRNFSDQSISAAVRDSSYAFSSIKPYAVTPESTSLSRSWIHPPSHDCSIYCHRPRTLACNDPFRASSAEGLLGRRAHPRKAKYNDLAPQCSKNYRALYVPIFYCILIFFHSPFKFCQTSPQFRKIFHGSCAKFGESAIKPSVEYVLHLPSNFGNAFPIWALPYGNVSAIAFNDRFRILIRSKKPCTGGNWTTEQRTTETILFAHHQLQLKKNDICPASFTGLQVERFCERVLCPCCQSDSIQEDVTIAICAKVIRALRNHQDIRDIVLGRECVNLSHGMRSFPPNRHIDDDLWHQLLLMISYIKLNDCFLRSQFQLNPSVLFFAAMMAPDYQFKWISLSWMSTEYSRFLCLWSCIAEDIVSANVSSRHLPCWHWPDWLDRMRSEKG